jgi:hypothetical protein
MAVHPQAVETVNPFRRTHLISVNGVAPAPAVTIRPATARDADRVRILAELDEAPVPAQPLLLAFVGEELWVALSLRSRERIADPFRASGEVAELVVERARQLTGEERRGVGGFVRRPRLSPAR